MVTWLDVVGGRLGEERLKPLSHVKTDSVKEDGDIVSSWHTLSGTYSFLEMIF